MNTRLAITLASLCCLSAPVAIAADAPSCVKPTGADGRVLNLDFEDGTLKHLREAERLASEAGDDRRIGWVSAYLSNCLSSHGEQSQSVACGRRALELGMAVGDANLQIMGRFFLGVAYHCGREDLASVETF